MSDRYEVVDNIGLFVSWVDTIKEELRQTDRIVVCMQLMLSIYIKKYARIRPLHLLSITSPTEY